MPTRHRDALVAQCEGRLTLTLHPDGCVLVYPRPVWEARRVVLSQLNTTARDLLRMMVGGASEVELDSAGRILVSPELREEAGLQRDVKLMGVGAYFELWDVERKKARDEACRATLLDGAAAAGFTF